MHAVRVPILGVAIAVALLLVENLGAIAYRDLEQRERDQAAAAVAERQAVAAAEARKREIEALIDQLERLERERERLMNEIKRRQPGCGNRFHLDRDLDELNHQLDLDFQRVLDRELALVR